jgi:hypothetical protein
MGQFSMKFIIICSLVGLGVFFGIDLATSGIETINGPLSTQSSTAGKLVKDAKSVQAIKQKQDREEDKHQATEPSGKPPKKAEDANPQAPHGDDVAAGDSGPSGVNRFGNKIGGLLQIMAHHGIESTASLIEKVFN